MRVAIGNYLSLRFAPAGRARPAVDCWGLYRLVVGERTGIWLGEFAGVSELRETARLVRDASVSGGWLPVAPGEERPLDLLLMRGLVRAGTRVTALPVHVGCVTAEARVLDIEEIGGVRERVFRNTARAVAQQDLANRVIGIFRPEALA